MSEHSFAILAYGDSPFLPACIDSLLKQTSKSTIYISTSTPSSYIAEVAERYKIPVLVTESGLGIAHDWNFSISQSKTRYLTLAHQDDIYLPDYTEDCIERMEKFGDALICFTDYVELINEEERKFNLLLMVKRSILLFFMPFRKQVKHLFWKKRMLSIGCPIAAPSVTYNLQNLNNFQFSSEFSINMDWDAWYRMAALEGRFVYVDKILLQHRIHEASATSKGIEANQRQLEDLIMFKRFWPGFIVSMLTKLYSFSYRSNKV